MQAMIFVVIIAVACGLGYWIIDAIPVPQPINRWAKILLIVIAAILLIGVLLNMAGVSLPR